MVWDKLKVCFLCPTYGRGPDQLSLLGEKIYWFLQQQPHERVEIVPQLLILNDSRNQTFYVDSSLYAKGVRIVNMEYRFSTLGEKYNSMMAMSDADVFIPDEDDDISLPDRMKQSVEWLYFARGGVEKGKIPFYDPGIRYYQEKGSQPILDHKGCTHHTSCWLKGKLFYPPVTGNQDQLAELTDRTSQHHIGRGTSLGCQPKAVYVYRWGYSKNHLSRNADMEKAWRNYPNVAGSWELIPTMVEDYSPLMNQG